MFLKINNPIQTCQLKFDSNAKGVFEGYASVFNSDDAVGDTILPGAFAKSISSGRNIKMFVNHGQHEVPVGDWTQLKEDAHGLLVIGKIDLNHKDGPTVYSALERGAMDGLSIGFTLKKDDFEQKEGTNGSFFGGNRIIKNLHLMETSIVSFPCEGGARISAVKADIEGFVTLKDYENYLRDVGGFSKSMATTLVSQLVKTVRSDYENEMQRNTEQVGKEALSILTEMQNRIKG